MDNRFTSSFGDGGGYVCADDRITAEVDGFVVTARLEYDPDSSPREYDADGCCFDTSDPDHGEESAAIIAAWDNDEWHYFGVVLSVAKEGVELDDHAASLWGIEGNFPRKDGGLDNSYFTETANELLDEALDSAKAVLARLIAA